LNNLLLIKPESIGLFYVGKSGSGNAISIQGKQHKEETQLHNQEI